MTTSQIEIVLIAVLVAVACALPGVFLVLRRMAMMSDAISHAILPGIVVAFFLTHDLSSPLLVVGAALTGLITAFLVETLANTGRVREDAAIGLVFPALFALGVVLLTRFAGDVHLDLDVVLLGELAFAPFDRMIVAGRNIGPKAIYVMGAILLLNASFITLFYKELKLATFDPALATSLGFLPAVLHYALMALVSVTVVGAFDAVGAILVVALLVASPATAYLLTDRLSSMLVVSAGIGATAAISGYGLAHALDVSIAGSMASCAGLLFALAAGLAPRRGLISQLEARRQLRWRVAVAALSVHLLQHESSPRQLIECRPAHLVEHLNWSERFAAEVVRRAQRQQVVERSGDILKLTDLGRALAEAHSAGTGRQLAS